MFVNDIEHVIALYDQLPPDEANINNQMKIFRLNANISVTNYETACDELDKSGVINLNDDIRTIKTKMAIFRGTISGLAQKGVKKEMNGDITAGYIVTDVERLRKPIQQITDYFLKCMGVQPCAEVLTIQPQGTAYE